jgi:putative transposase
LRVEGDRVLIPRIGEIALKEKIVVPVGTRIIRIIVKAQAGRWFVVFRLREDSWVAPEKRVSDECVGIDLGVGNRFATLSTGEVKDNPRFFRSDQRKVKRASQKIAKCKKGSKRRHKAVQKLARVHYKVKCRREDFLHKITTELVKSHDHIVIEDLAVKNMMKNHKLAKSFADVSLSEFVRQLIYKAEWYGCTLVIADRWFPSTQLCSECKHREKLELFERYWICSSCNTPHDRDYNAAINLEDYGREFLGISSRSACKTSQFEAVRDETRIFDEERYLLAFGNEK